MKNIISSVLLFLIAFACMAQTVVQPPTVVEESGGTSVWVKIALAVGAIAVMSLIFYLAKNFNKKK